MWPSTASGPVKDRLSLLPACRREGAELAPTGRAVEFTEITPSGIVDGKMVEHRAERSTLEVLLQLDVAVPGY